MKKKDLKTMAQVSHYTTNKLTYGDNVTTDVLGRICKALDCSLGDIMEFVDELADPFSETFHPNEKWE